MPIFLNNEESMKKRERKKRLKIGWVFFILFNLISMNFVKVYAFCEVPKIETSFRLAAGAYDSAPDSEKPVVTQKGETVSEEQKPASGKNENSSNVNQSATSSNTSQKKQNQSSTNKVVESIREAVAKWYYIMRLIVIAFMLVLLIFVGIKMAISTIASDKAVYKQMLVDWVAGMIIVFSIHYIMIAILNVNDAIVASLQDLVKQKVTAQEEFEYGDDNQQKTASEMETTLYESARTRAYSLKLTDGFTGLIIYGVLVYYAWRFAIMYFKRIVNIVILTLLAPVVSGSYAFNKVMSGKSKIFSTWLSEYIMNVSVQTIHAVIYVSFMSTALLLSLESISGVVLAIILLNFMVKADKILRQIFRLAGGKGSLAGDMTERSTIQDVKKDVKSFGKAMLGGTIARTAMKGTYAAVTLPVRKTAEYAFGKVMEARANDPKYQENLRKKQEQQEKEARRSL